MVGVEIRFKNRSSDLSVQGYTVEQQAQIYDAMLQDVMDNTRWYLDQLDFLREVRVSWASYQKGCATKPYKFVKDELKAKAL